MRRAIQTSCSAALWGASQPRASASGAASIAKAAFSSSSACTSTSNTNNITPQRTFTSSLPFPSSSSYRCRKLAGSSPWSQHRNFSSTPVSLHGGKGRPAPGTGIKVIFKNHKGDIIKEVEANEGDDIVDLSWEYDLDIEAACEKSVACSTCHCILDQESYDKLEEPTDEENDMLDMAFGLEDTSRLGCQM